MRWSQSFIPTLRDDPADAEAVSHKLLVRAGYIRQLMSGVYSLLPLGERVVARKITGIVRDGDERDRGAGVPAARAAPGRALAALGTLGAGGRGDVPAEGPPRRRHRARHDARGGLHHARRRAAQLPAAAADLVPAPDQVPRRAAPEVGPAARARVHDEGLLLLRPRRGGPRRRRSSGTSRPIAGSSRAAASRRSRSRPPRARWAAASRSSSWWRATPARTGSPPAPPAATRRTWRRRARCCPPSSDGAGLAAPERFATPGVRTIEDLARFAGGPTPAERQIKTLVYRARRRDGAGAAARRPRSWSSRSCSTRPAPRGAAGPARPRSAPRSAPRPGSLGAVGVARPARARRRRRCAGRRDMVTGANQDGFHLRGRRRRARHRASRAGSTCARRAPARRCPMCESPLRVDKTIEVGHIFKLGTRYIGDARRAACSTKRARRARS